MPFLLTTVSVFELEQKVSFFVLSSFSLFLNPKTSAVTNLNTFDSVSTCNSLFSLQIQYL